MSHDWPANFSPSRDDSFSFLMEIMSERNQVLTSLERFLQTEIAPQANRLDEDTTALNQALLELNQFQLFGLRIPQRYGGWEADLVTFRQLQTLIPRYSGALAFLQTQHHSAAAVVSHSENHSLQQKYLPAMATGERLVGIGFSQLRRPHNPPVTATPVTDGYRIQGTVPWITGYGIFQSFIIGAMLPDGQALYGMMPLQQQEKFQVSVPMELAVMEATNTVSATVDDWFLPEQDVLFIKPANAIHESDQKNVLHHGFYALGCAQAGLDILATAAEKKELPFLEQTHQTLQEEKNRVGEAMFAAIDPNESSFDYRLQLRAQAIRLAQRCAHAGVIASSGAANARSHPAQRVYREALLFSVSGQTKAVMEASLKGL